MRIRCISTGVVRPKRRERGVRRYLAGGWSDATLPVNVFLVEHPDGFCLFDTGQTQAAAAPGYFPRWYPFFRLARFELGPGDEAVSQLRRLGVEPQSVRWVVLSHLHTDHVGGLSAFAGAEVLVSRTEWARAIGIRGRLRGYLPQRWPHGLEPRLVDFQGPPVGPFATSFDVAGDGRLVLVPTPGHTPGHIALLVRDGGRGWLLAGDAAPSRTRLPPELAALERGGTVVLTAHDPSVARVLDPVDASAVA